MVVLGKKERSIDSSFWRIYSITLWVVSCVVCHYICCLKVRWVPRVDQSFGIYTCQKFVCRDCVGQPSDYLEKEVSCWKSAHVLCTLIKIRFSFETVVFWIRHKTSPFWLSSAERCLEKHLTCENIKPSLFPNKPSKSIGSKCNFYLQQFI